MNALVTNIQGYSIHDGPGIRTVVFFKGCGLGCRWCANPEGISGIAQTGFIEKLCAGCGKCAAVCPNGAINPGGDGHRIDYSRCTGCGACSDACLYGALVRYGKEMTVDEVFDVVRRDKMFFEDGGGVTASGGEPLLHHEFVRELFQRLKDDGISTCLETSGFTPAENLIAVLPVTDHVLFDIKLYDSEKHREYTGKPNDRILSNAKTAAYAGADILFRVPLIPGVNDDIGNISETAEFLRGITARPRVQLMPYHRMGDSKYKALNLDNTLRELAVMPLSTVDEVRKAYEELGVECSISR